MASSKYGDEGTGEASAIMAGLLLLSGLAERRDASATIMVESLSPA